uniref:(northern house mosquito) hypothetical protein n=1 Tax=Culex pipiens TaxID=7175 RepID=A0A8D8BH58_CULPI
MVRIFRLATLFQWKSMSSYTLGLPKDWCIMPSTMCTWSFPTLLERILRDCTGVATWLEMSRSTLQRPTLSQHTPGWYSHVTMNRRTKLLLTFKSDTEHNTTPCPTCLSRRS